MRTFKFDKKKFNKRLKEEVNGNDHTSSKRDFLSVGDNKTIEIRIIPNANSEDGWPFIETKQHWHKHYNPKVITFFSRATIGELDPFIELASKIYNDDEIPLEERKETFKSLMPSTSYKCYVIERGHENEGLKIWSMSKTIYDTIINYLNDDDYSNLLNVEDGIDFKLTKTVSESNRIKYSIAPQRNDSEIWNENIGIDRDKFYKMIFDEQDDMIKSGKLKIIDEEEQMKCYEKYIEKMKNGTTLNNKNLNGDDVETMNSTTDKEKNDLINKLKQKMG